MICVAVATLALLIPPPAYEVDFSKWPGVFDAKIQFELMTTDGKKSAFGPLTIGAMATAEGGADVFEELFKDSKWIVSRPAATVVVIHGTKDASIWFVTAKSARWSPTVRRMPKQEPPRP